METKTIQSKIPFWKSKTFLFNALTAIVSLAEYVTPLNIISAPVMIGISVAGNILLRSFFTTQKLTIKTDEQLNKVNN